MNFSEQDLDAIINSVEVTLAKAEKLSKDDGSQADDQSQMPAQDAAPAEQAGQEAAAPEMDAQPPQADAGQEDQQAAPAAEAAPQADEQQLENEAQQPISDEELQQIYASLDDQELERHYSIIRDQLSQRYSQDDQSQQPPAQAPQEQPAQQEAAAPQASPEEDNMNKSESAVITALQKTVADQAQAIEMITKAFETIAKPQRKSVTNIQVMQKSEFENGGEKQLSKEEIREKASKLSKSGTLNSDERSLINRFFLQGEGQDEVQKLINSKGGK